MRAEDLGLAFVLVVGEGAGAEVEHKPPLDELAEEPDGRPFVFKLLQIAFYDARALSRGYGVVAADHLIAMADDRITNSRGAN